MGASRSGMDEPSTSGKSRSVKMAVPVPVQELEGKEEEAPVEVSVRVSFHLPGREWKIGAM